MLADDEGGMLKRIPDSVQALIAARIDGLDAGDKRRAPARRARRAACSGAARSTRSRQNVDVACGRSTGCSSASSSRPEAHSSISGERAFRFTHGLIREVAYGDAQQGAARRGPPARSPRGSPSARRTSWRTSARYHLDARRDARRRARRIGAGRARRTRPPAALEAAGRRALRRGSFVVARTLCSARGRARADARAAGTSPLRPPWRLSDVSTARDEARAVLEDARAERRPRRRGPRARAPRRDRAPRRQRRRARERARRRGARGAARGRPARPLRRAVAARDDRLVGRRRRGVAPARRGDGRARAGDGAARPREHRAHAARRRRERLRATSRRRAS